jgi:hypothetical protein
LLSWILEKAVERAKEFFENGYKKVGLFLQYQYRYSLAIEQPLMCSIRFQVEKHPLQM